MTLVDVLVNVLDCLDRRTDLDIDVAVVSEIVCQSMALPESLKNCLLCCKIWIIRDNISIVISMEWVTLLNCTAIVGSGIIWIAVWIESCGLSEPFGISLAAFIVNHAFSSTGTMKHAVGYSLI